MLRRAFPWVLPALLALTFAVPTGSADGVHTIAIKRRADAGAVSIASTPLHHNDEAASGWSQWTEEKDDPDRIAQASAITAWAPVTLSVPPCRASDVLRRTRPACTAFPRGPPSA